MKIIICYILVVVFFFFQVVVYSSLGVGDLGILIINLYLIINKKRRPLKGRFKVILLMFFLWLLVSPFILNNLDMSLYINRMFRLSNIFIGVILISSRLTNNPFVFYKMIRMISYASIIISILIVIEYLLGLVGFNLDLRLVGREVEKSNLRPHSIYSEPSIAAMVLFMASIIIYAVSKVEALNSKIFSIAIFFSLLGMITTLSFTGLMGAIIIIITNLRQRKTKIFLSLLLVLLAIFVNVRDGDFLGNFTNRFENILNQDDNSANQRLVGSWLVPMTFVENIYLGEGTGQEVVKLEKYDFSKIEKFSELNLKINNSLALILYENGLIGLILFSLLILSLWKRDHFIPIVMIFYCFVHGAYFFSLLWMTIIFLLIKGQMIVNTEKIVKTSKL